MLQQTFEALKTSFREGNDACIDACKGLVECACLVIIENLDDPADPIRGWKKSPLSKTNPSFRDWVSAALKLLEITERRDDQFSKILSQHFSLVETLGHFRNAAGPVSHGKAGFVNKLTVHHQRAAVLAADALITFLHEAYLEHEPDPATTLEPYERFEFSNALIDRNTSLTAEVSEDGWLSVQALLPTGETLPISAEPSRFLFGVDREAYKEALAACREAPDPPDEPDEEEIA